MTGNSVHLSLILRKTSIPSIPVDIEENQVIERLLFIINYLSEPLRQLDLRLP
jgi:hypothetical protein